MSVDAVAVKCAAFNLKKSSAEIRRAAPILLAGEHDGGDEPLNTKRGRLGRAWLAVSFSLLPAGARAARAGESRPRVRARALELDRVVPDLLDLEREERHAVDADEVDHEPVDASQSTPQE